VNGLVLHLLSNVTAMRAPRSQVQAVVSNICSFVPSLLPFLSSHSTYLVHISSPPYLRTSYVDVFFTVVKQGDSMVVL
jgi:hypothetical protein